MAEIPTYDSSQVQERALPGVRQTDRAGDPALLGGAQADDLIRAGGGALAAGNALNAAAYQMQEKENLEAVQAATTRYGESALEFKVNAQKNRTLHGAAGLSTEFTEFHKKTLEEIERGLGNEAQRRAFRATAQRAGLGVRQDIASFEIGETNKAGIATHKATQQTFINIGATAITDDVVDANKQELIRMTRAFAATRNLDEVTTKAEVDSAVAEFHANRVHHLARNDPEGALNYFKKVEREITDLELRGKIGEFADKAGAEGLGVRVGGEIAKKFFDGKDASPFELDKMEEAARERFKNNPAALKATISNLHERKQAFEVSRDSRAEAVQGKVNQAILNGASLGQVRGMPEFIALPGKQQLAISDFIENRMLRNEQRAAAREARADASESRRERRLTREAYPDVLRLMTNPDALMALSKDQVLNLLPKIGVEHTQSLLQTQDKYRNNQAALSEGKIDSEDFKMVAMGAGFDVEKAKGDDARRLVGLRSRVEQQIGVEQQRSGGKLTRDQKVQIMQREIDNAVMIDRSFWPDTQRPVGATTAGELKDAYVVVDNQEVRLSSIPATARQEIITLRQARGLPVSEADIARTWLRAQKPKDALK